MISERTIERLAEIEKRFPKKTYSQELIKDLCEEFGVSPWVVYRHMRTLNIKPEPKEGSTRTPLPELRKYILSKAKDGKLPRGFISEIALQQGVSRQRIQQIVAKMGISGTMKLYPDTKTCDQGHEIPYRQKTCMKCIKPTYTCSVCFKEFRRRAKLVNHMQTRVKSKMNVYCSHACRNLKYKARLDI